MIYLYSLAGGILIGLAVSWMLLANGRVTGISGILGGILKFQPGDFLWRVYFFAGLVAGGFLLNLMFPDVIGRMGGTSLFRAMAAGFIVGFGTAMGSGCTSGHGVCGLARLSPRSIVATMTFIGFGVLTVFVRRWLGDI